MNHFLWWLGGWPVGIIIGWLAHDLYRTRVLAQKVNSKVDKILHEHHDQPGRQIDLEPHQHDERGAIRPDFVAMAIVLIVTLWAAVSSTIASHRVSDTQDDLDRQVACQQAFNRESSAVTKQRAEWADEDRAALTQMIRAQRTAKTDQDAADAYDRYLATAQANDAKRKANPYPSNHCATSKEHR